MCAKIVIIVVNIRVLRLSCSNRNALLFHYQDNLIENFKSRK